MPTFADVVSAWRKSDPSKIHPSREHKSEMAYWESGKPQAEFVLNLVGVGAAVLDFGCGDGRIAIPMAKLGMVVTAVDAAPEMIERLRHESEVQDAGGIQSFVWDGRTLEFDPVFDAVNARAVFIHHAHADVATMVNNLSDCLKSGGLLIADWPLGTSHERRDWIDVTTWAHDHRLVVAEFAGLQFVSEGDPAESIPSVWRKL